MDPSEMTVWILLPEIDEKSSVVANVDQRLRAVPDGDGRDDRIRHEHDICHTAIIDPL